MDYTLAVLFGIFSSIGWGIAPIFSKRSYSSGGNPIIASLILSIVGFSCLMILSLILYDIKYLLQFGLWDIYPFIISGIVATGIGRFLSYKGIDVVGAGINSSFIASYSVFGVLLAYIFLGEVLSIVKIIGVASVFIGLFIVSISKGGNIKKDVSKILLMIPLLGSILYGFGTFFRRFGLSTVSQDMPFIYAVTINEFTALIILSIFIIGFKKDCIEDMEIHNYKKFVLSGIFNVIGISSSFAALNFGPVYIGSTIGSTSTIVTLISTHLFLNDLEKITTRIYVGTIVVVIGVILVVI